MLQNRKTYNNLFFSSFVFHTRSSETDNAYRFGFNGKEKDDEITGQTGATYDYGFRIYDSRIGKFLSVDPLTRSYPMLTPYQFASNSPIMAIDLDGLEADIAIYGQKAGDEKTFLLRAESLQKRAMLSSDPHGVSNGLGFVDLLKEQTQKEGSVRSFTFFSHGFEQGVILDGNRGFYKTNSAYGRTNGRLSGTPNPESGYVSDVVAGMQSGEIKFESNAIAIFAGCNLGNDKAARGVSLAKDWTMQTGVTSIASRGQVVPEIVDGVETGRLVSTKNFFMFKQTEDGMTKINLGNTIDPVKYMSPVSKIEARPITPLQIETPNVEIKPR
ncbi:MAG: hypothetical protein CVU05_14265 [Bacteroidetes bacterium HGW-Bacteroidetes-21]|jgi:RHS repeat-associated protein|nr:MAG: hypothetical protein CVU05_14265 [Bacteroidetes bacterium HGW-Bacteroidetes-21]